MKQLILTCIAVSCNLGLTAQTRQTPIKINQVGYYPQQEKYAIIEPTAKAKTFQIKDAKGHTVWRGKAIQTTISPFSKKQRQTINFSEITKPGNYTLVAGKYTHPITIQEHPYKDALTAAIKAFYLQRSGMAIEKLYAGKYAREAAHMDTEVMVHPSAASKDRPSRTIISSPKGWYDAGDYNKYIVNSAFSIGLMLQSYQLNQAYLSNISTNIPESSNTIPDILDEIMYNLEWMMSMQDPTDGGVYHKLTTPNFEGFVMPKDCHQQRYVVQKSTAATLDFAATMALAARIYKSYPQYNKFCQEAIQAAERAYAWAVKNPTVYYDQDSINEKFSPKIATGTYGDSHAEDEVFWAATEMYLTTKENAYLEQAKQFAPSRFSIPTWGQVEGLGLLQWLNQGILNTPEASLFPMKNIKESLKQLCDQDIQTLNGSSFHSIFGNQASDFIWGSNSEKCAGRGIAQMYQYALSKDNRYKDAALSAIDYLFGRNATGYCYLTGFGTQQVMHPHHRISEADGITAPLPGLLAGGANAGKEDAATAPPYSSDAPDECYQDNMGSYASNEIAINWNAYLVALLGWMR